MNADIEIGIETYLSDNLSAGFPAALIHAATKRAELSRDAQSIVIVVREVKRYDCTGELYRAELALVVTTPVIAGTTVQQHRDLVKAAQWAMHPRVTDDQDQAAVDAAKAALSAAIADEMDGYVSPSGRMTGPREQHTDEDWVTTLEGFRLITEA